MSAERRRAPRYPLVADAEIVKGGSDAPLKARTSDVSIVGCFINTIYALPQGTEIQLHLKHQGATFTTKTEVARPEPSMGFGVNFLQVKGAQQRILRNWLEQLPLK